MGGPVPERRETRRPPVSLMVIAALAAAAAIVHVAFPDLAIDAVTLGLLGVAALPWLAQIVKTLKVGSLELDLRDLQQDIYEVRDKVVENAQKVDDLADQVQRITFTGAPVATRDVSELAEAMNAFYVYLRRAGLPIPPTEPVVEIVDKSFVDKMYYDPKKEKIFVSKRLTGDITRVLQLYAQFLATSIVALPDERWSPQLRLIVRALSVYLSCSFRGSPEVARESYRVYQRDETNEHRRRNLETREQQANLQTNRFRIRPSRFADVEAPQTRENAVEIRDWLAWGGAFWRLRDLLTPESADRALVEAWVELAAGPRLAAFDGIVAGVARAAEERGGAALAGRVRDVFRRRGLTSVGVVRVPPGVERSTSK